MSRKYVDSLTRDLQCLLEEDFETDVTFAVGHGSNTKYFSAHSILLWARCPRLKASLIGAGDYFFQYPDAWAEGFPHVLHYIYTGVLAVDVLTAKQCIDVLCIFDLFGVIEDVIKDVERRLLGFKDTAWVKENLDTIGKILQNPRNKLDDLEKCVAGALFTQDNINLIDEDTLLDFLSRKVVPLPQSEIWKLVLHWVGVSHEDATCINNDAVLTDRLKKCIVLINFREIPSREISSLVLPYKDVLPKDVFTDLLEHYLSVQDRAESVPHRPSNTSPVQGTLSTTTTAGKSLERRSSLRKSIRHVLSGMSVDEATKWLESIPKTPSGTSAGRSQTFPKFTIDSKILSIEQATMIASFLDKKWVKKGQCYKPNEVPYTFRLLQRASEHGLSSRVFHSLCDTITPTICVTKIVGTSRVIGGYNPVSWSGEGGYKPTTESFVFLLDGDRQNGAEFRRVQKPEQAIRVGKNRGPTFGNNELIFISRCRSKKSPQQKYAGAVNHQDKDHVYEKRFTGVKNFKMDDYEVFQLKKL